MLTHEFLSEMRIEKRKSLRGLASELGISAPYLSDIEHGKRKLSFYLMSDICFALGLGWDMPKIAYRLSQELNEISPAATKMLIENKNLYLRILQKCYTGTIEIGEGVIDTEKE